MPTEAKNVPKQHGRRASDKRDSGGPAVAERKHQRSVRIRMLNAVAIVVSAVLALVALNTLEQILEADRVLSQANSDFTTCEEAADKMQIASDYLTSQSRMYIVTTDRQYLDNYLEELLVKRAREDAVATLQANLEEEGALAKLRTALALSDELAERELYAMRLVADASQLQDMPEILAQVQVDPEDDALSDQEKLDYAESMVLGPEYQSAKTQISENVNACAEDLISTLHQRQEESDQRLRNLLASMRVIVLLLLAMVVFVIFATIFLILWPLAMYIQRINQGRPLTVSGAHELRFLANAYNSMYEENHQRITLLKHAAEHDPLTGLCNRSAYDTLLAENQENIALLLVDVDKFEEVNDTYGHDVGDAVLCKVGGALEQTFRTTDLPCRIGGDEFAVIMTDMTPNLAYVVSAKVENVASIMRDTSDGLPEITLSVGVAFSGAHPGEDDIYRAADNALYLVKERGRNGCAFYGEA